MNSRESEARNVRNGETDSKFDGPWLVTKSGLRISGVNPRFLAEEFWVMCSDEQAEFFAHLERIAGYKLCLQMAHVVEEIIHLADKGDRDAQNGFQTMLAHAQDFVQTAIESRHHDSKRAIEKMVSAAKETHQ